MKNQNWKKSTKTAIENYKYATQLTLIVTSIPAILLILFGILDGSSYYTSLLQVAILLLVLPMQLLFVLLYFLIANKLKNYQLISKQFKAKKIKEYKIVLLIIPFALIAANIYASATIKIGYIFLDPSWFLITNIMMSFYIKNSLTHLQSYCQK